MEALIPDRLLFWRELRVSRTVTHLEPHLLISPRPAPIGICVPARPGQTIGYRVEVSERDDLIRGFDGNSIG